MQKILILSVLTIAVLVSSGCVQQWEEEKIVIEAGQVYLLRSKVNTGNTRIKIYIEIESTAPLDIYHLPTEEDYEKFMEHKEFMHHTECYHLSILSKSFECVLDGDDVLVILNDNSYDAIVMLRKKIE